MIVNGKEYPLWSQFVERKNEWIGGVLEDFDMGEVMKTKIKDIELRPNGDDSAYFSIIGEDFDCGFDVSYGGITVGDEGWVTFSRFYGGTHRIKEP